MRRYVQLDLVGRDWWIPFTAFWIVTLLSLAAQRLLSPPGYSAAAKLGPMLVVVLVFLAVGVIVSSIYTIILYSIVFPKVSLGDKSLAFDGAIGPYLGIVVPGLLLSLVTAGVYAAWFSRRVTAYLAAHTRLCGRPFEFSGTGGKLFVYALVTLVAPVLVVSAGIAVLVPAASGAGVSVSAVEIVIDVAPFIILLSLVPFVYLRYKWYTNLRWSGLLLQWETHFWPAVLTILGQALLTVVTIGVYWPAAALRLYRYFVDRSVVIDSGEEAGRFGFDGHIGRGFGLLWGQALLSIVTLGFYLPWAYSKVGRWILGATWYESSRSIPRAGESDVTPPL